MYELGVTQEEAAKVLDIDVSTFNLKLNDHRRFYHDEVVALSKLLRLTSKKDLREYFGLGGD